VITPNGAEGWVWAAYLSVKVDLNTLPVTGEAEPTAIPPPPAVGISGVTSTSRQVFLHGQSLGNHVNVFSKVGDSLSVAAYVYGPFGWGTYNLRDYGYLQSALNFFLSGNARAGNSFVNASIAADNGWTTTNILDPARAKPGVCGGGETPLACELRVVKPSVALILIGTNDVASLSPADYSANLTTIVDTSINAGVIPVLWTIPDRNGLSGQVAAFNQIVIAAARSHDIPLCDYYSVLQALPNHGLSPDGVHPSWPPGDYGAAADLTPDNLRYGYTVRNLMLLQVLDLLYRQVLY
jgi:hypothetical protein